MHAITIGYRVMPLNYIWKHSPRYAVCKYISKKILGTTVKKLLYDLSNQKHPRCKKGRPRTTVGVKEVYIA